MPYSEENEKRQGHEKELQLKGVFLEVVVPPHLDEQADTAPPEKILYQNDFGLKKNWFTLLQQEKFHR